MVGPIKKTAGGEGEIRTPETCSSLPVFETGAFDHSATSPHVAKLAFSEAFGKMWPP